MFCVYSHDIFLAFVLQASWSHTGLTAAVNSHQFDPDKANTTWCGKRCGKCVKLTTTGTSSIKFKFLFN